MQSEVEEDILKTMQRLQDSVNNLNQTGTCQVDNDCASSFKELVQVRLLFTDLRERERERERECFVRSLLHVCFTDS